ncbi:DUF1360 domain-containing protein [Streptomyces virginiae]|uniref:DUF1360 domain-containing protein n=1 Tax=Streptomyces virginiae TaxID=1961 RepID=UPI0036744EDB
MRGEVSWQAPARPAGAHTAGAGSAEAFTRRDRVGDHATTTLPKTTRPQGPGHHEELSWTYAELFSLTAGTWARWRASPPTPAAGLCCIGGADGPAPPYPGPGNSFIATATFRASRLITKATVTRPARAPFTRVDGAGAPAELNETPREEFSRKTVGELISCPFCLSVWVVTTFTGARAIWPEGTRAAAAALTALALSDALQLGHSALVKRAGH